MILSVRLDPQTEALVSRLARRRGQSKSQVVRDAIKALAQMTEKGERKSAYDRIAHLIGIASGGPPDLSHRTGEKFRKLLQQRRTR
ncbi:MAG: ribbon-helix-helix protein, CopG family [Armatimonadetes bacterium]|nr:ribbon-helix-helix protein, CopG family [Armatimonadota bacterium]